MTIYIIQVTPEASFSKVSQIGYKTMTEAEEFIESRTGNPQRVGSHLYCDEDETEYLICEVTV